jgi:molybdopterin/thiamine biosynthesis adenylyltransferase/rhodanese-related sulfurtransferase
MDAQQQQPREISARQASENACPEHPLIDIREPLECIAGTPVGAVFMEAGELLDKCSSDERFARAGGAVLCAEGVRSLKLVDDLRRRGFGRFSSVAGGMLAWLAAGLPVVGPADLKHDQLERYARHLVMPQVGLKGQRKLLDSRVLLAGVGGLNSPAAMYLAAAGVGTLGLLDDDRVERSNLQRQVIHGESSLQLPKTESAARRLADINPDTRIELLNERVCEKNAAGLVQGWNVVVDGTDNFPARYALNDACARQGIPLVYGAVMRFQGQVSVFDPGRDEASPCFRCLMPEAPPEGATASCSEAGVLGVMPGIIGTLQAAEALKLLLGAGRPLTGQLLLVDTLTMEFRRMRIPRITDCPACGRRSERPE